MENKDFIKFFPKEHNVGVMVVYLNAMFNHNFLEILKDMSEGISNGSEYYGYNFPDAYEPEEDGYFKDGIEFYVNGNSQIIDNHTYYRYLRITCDSYIKNYPEFKSQINELLEKLKYSLSL